MGNVGGGELGLSVAILTEDVVMCLAIELVLCAARAAVVAPGWIEVMLDRDASVVMLLVWCCSRRAGNRASWSIHLWWSMRV